MAKEELLQPVTQDADLLAIIDEEISTGITFDNDTEHDRRDTALEYYRGYMQDLPADPDWSHAVSKDVADTIDDIIPGLMRVFAGAGQIVQYNPQKPGDEQSASQATDYINYLWENDLNGYLVLVTAVHDALLVRNGIIKIWWDPTPDYETQDLTGLDDLQLVQLLQDPELELIGHNETVQMIVEPMSGQSMPISLHDVRVRRASNNGRMRLEGIPPEDFGISRLAKTPDDARMSWHRIPKTRSDLIKEGFPRETVDDLPAWSADVDQRAAEREQNGMFANAPSGNKAMENIDIYECYMMYDADGDGIAERCKIVVAGPNGGRKLLSVDPWPDDVPFVDLKPLVVPHRWEGRSIADMTMDLQRIKTAILRGGLDNIYLTNRPQTEVVEKNIIDSDEVMLPKIGGVVRVKERGSVTPIPPAFIGDKALMWLNYVDTIKKQRTGSDQGGAALDATALDPQTATAEQIEHDKAYSRIELIARNMAELGLKRLFGKALRIMVRNQDRPRMIRLRNTWVNMDPRAWNANMDATINVGLGTGSRERDLAMLSGIAKQQDQVVAELGPMNPIVPPSKWVGTRHKMVEAAGLRNADQYFSPISDQDFQQWQASQPPKIDPKVQADQQAQQGKMALAANEQQGKLQLAQQKNEADIQMEREKAAQQFGIEWMKAQLQHDVDLRELSMEDALKRMELKQRDYGPGDTELRRPN